MRLLLVRRGASTLCLASLLLAFAPLIPAQSSLQLSGRATDAGLAGVLLAPVATQRFGTVEDLA